MPAVTSDIGLYGVVECLPCAPLRALAMTFCLILIYMIHVLGYGVPEVFAGISYILPLGKTAAWAVAVTD